MKKALYFSTLMLLNLCCGKEKTAFTPCDCGNLIENAELPIHEGFVSFPSETNNNYELRVAGTDTQWNIPICPDSNFVAQIQSKNIKNGDKVNFIAMYTKAKNEFFIPTPCQVINNGKESLNNPYIVKSINK